MEDKLIEVLKNLGDEGIQAFYVYTALEYITIWALIGLSVWGVRSIWKYETRKKDNWN